MKIELKKETSIDGVWYFIYIDNVFHKCKRDKLEACLEFEKMKNAEVTVEILESITI
jgi:hypothetical protein